MHVSRAGRRALTCLSLSVSLSSLSIGCSSSGSAFDPNGGGSGSVVPSGTGGTQSNTTGPTGGSSTDSTSGSGTTLPGGGSSDSNGGGGIITGGTGTGTGGSAGGGPTGGSSQGGSQSMTGGSGGSGGSAQTPTCPKPAGQICHEFIANDNSRAQVNYVNEFTSKAAGGVVWVKSVGHNTSAPENSPRTIEIVDNAKATGGKAVLVSVNDGYVELDLSNGNKLADVTVQFSGITGACRLPDGTTALGTNAQIRIVNATGSQTRAFNLPSGQNLRAINRDPATGHFWFSKTETVYETTDQGQIVWQGFMGAGTKGYAVWWRDGGGAYGTTGEPATVVELDKDGTIVSTVGGRENFPELNLDFFSGFVRRPNGHYVVANWLGHLGSPGANTPEVIEFAPGANGGKATAVWTWGNQTLARQITNVFVLQ